MDSQEVVRRRRMVRDYRPRTVPEEVRERILGPGLAGCFIGIRPERIAALRTAFDVPEAYRPVGVVTVGYRAPDVPSPSLRRGRRPVEDVVHRGRW